MIIVRSFLCKKGNHSIWRGMGIRQMLPDNWIEQCQKYFLWFIYTICRKNIHSRMIVNIDQKIIVLVTKWKWPYL